MLTFSTGPREQCSSPCQRPGLPWRPLRRPGRPAQAGSHRHPARALTGPSAALVGVRKPWVPLGLRLRYKCWFCTFSLRKGQRCARSVSAGASPWSRSPLGLALPRHPVRRAGGHRAAVSLAPVLDYRRQPRPR